MIHNIEITTTEALILLKGLCSKDFKNDKDIKICEDLTRKIRKTVTEDLKEKELHG